MTIYELYDTNIKTLPIAERLRLARLILEDAAPDEPATAQAQEHYAQLVDEAYASGPATALTSQDFDNMRQAIRERAARRADTPHA